MGSGMTIAMAVARIANLIPTYRSPVLKGDGVYVLTPADTLPEQFRAAQRDRTAHYMTTMDGPTARTKPDHAPRFVVTSYGAVICWVTLDGRTHYADLRDPVTLPMSARGPARVRAVRRHLDAVRAVWPERFTLED